MSSDVVYPTGAMRDYEANSGCHSRESTSRSTRSPATTTGTTRWKDSTPRSCSRRRPSGHARRVEADNCTDEHDRPADRRAHRRGRPAPQGIRRADPAPGGAVLPAPDRPVRPDCRRYGGRPARGPRGASRGSVGASRPRGASSRWSFSDIPSTPAAITSARATDFAALHRLLREYDVAIVMAGDTHDLEYYAERHAGSPKVIHHFVNGGGGAYLSFGTALAFPADPATALWAFYPNRATRGEDRGHDAAIGNGRPGGGRAPRGLGRFGRVAVGSVRRQRRPVLPELYRGPRRTQKGRIRLLPYGVHGRLHWREMEVSAGTLPATPRRLASRVGRGDSPEGVR